MKKITALLIATLSGILLYSQEGDESSSDDAHQENEENIRDGFEDLNNFISAGRDAWEDYQNMQTLSRQECLPDFGTSGAAMMASTCQGNAQCSSCFTSAVNELSFVRRVLGRLSCIYNNTKSFTQSAISFGDNVSGIHGVTGLSWQHARAGIVESYDNFKVTYDNKYADMMGSLQRALMAIDNCEKQYGMTDWYDRFGFIYFEFMKEKYKRTD